MEENEIICKIEVRKDGNFKFEGSSKEMFAMIMEFAKEYSQATKEISDL